jgi:hypothetical protein
VQEHRLHPRREVSIETRLFLPGISRHEAAIIIPCRIVDVSKGGARVLVRARYRLTQGSCSWHDQHTANLTQDAEGVISLNDGTQIHFHQIERLIA